MHPHSARRRRFGPEARTAGGWRKASTRAGARALLLATVLLPAVGVRATETRRLMLSGADPGDAVEWQFRCSAGRGCGDWSSLPVPSQWELHGFGAYNYGHDEPQSSERGFYRRPFDVPEAWRESRVFLVFEGVMTDARVTVNGAAAGPVHQGGFYRFRHEVTGLLRYGGSNLLEVEVDKRSSDRSVQRAEREADYWIFGGIFRPVYLEVVPIEHISSLAIDAGADGGIQVEVAVAGLSAPAEIAAEIVDPGGEAVAVLFGSVEPALDGGDASSVTLNGAAAGIDSWSAETPILYRLRVLLRREARPLHRHETAFGFRTVAVRPGRGLFLNGNPIRLKGINRHSFWPDSGRATGASLSERDAVLIRSMNMNAVRTAHYPPDTHFLEACDRLGLYVVDELAGWHDAYDTEIGARRVEEMVQRDRNHPSIVLWSNGNEDGWNPDLDPLFRRFDPQGRPVIHPRGRFGDFDAPHYPTFSELAELLRAEETRGDGGLLVLPTELLHGLFDGGLGAGLAEFWELMRASPVAVGGFLWSLFDEAVVRTDEGGRLDTDGSHAADGIVGPYREPEGSVAVARHVFSPVRFDLRQRGPGRLRLAVENDFDFLDLSDCRFEWQLIRFPDPHEEASGFLVVEGGSLDPPAIAPRHRGSLEVELPAAATASDAWRLTVSTPDGAPAITWQLPLIDRREMSRRIVVRRQGSADLEQTADRLILRAGASEVEISRVTGLLAGLSHEGRRFPLAGGPRPVSGTARLTSLSHHAEPGAQVVAARFEGDLEFVIWRLYGSGWLQILYQYSATGEREYFGVGFDLPEGSVRRLRWLGEGPYRIWKNRRNGQLLEVWSKEFNDTVTGESWVYPEFKGYHAAPYWARLQTAAGRMTVVLADPGIDLQLLRPGRWHDPGHATAPFPDTGLAFLHGIPAIGTKFHPAADLGPSGRPPIGSGAYRGEIYLRLESPVGRYPGEFPRDMPAPAEREESR